MVARHLWTGSVSVESIKRQKEKPDQRLYNLLRPSRSIKMAPVWQRETTKVFSQENWVALVLRFSDGYLTKAIAQWLVLARSINACVPLCLISLRAQLTALSRDQLLPQTTKFTLQNNSNLYLTSIENQRNLFHTLQTK